MPTLKRRPTHRRTLMPHQERVLAYGVRTEHPAYLCEMRTGKTLVCIRWVQSLPGARRFMVLAPVTVLETWARELRLEGERFSLCHGVTREERERAIVKAWEEGESGRHWLLMSYEGLRSMGERYGKKGIQPPGVCFLPWDVVALDESPKIKNPSAQLARICCEGFRQTRHRAILTGLPNPEGDLDLIPQFLFLDGHFMGHGSFWSARSALFLKTGIGWVPKRGTRAVIKKYVHERAFVLTAAQAGMRNRIVPETRHVDLSPVQRRLYKQVEKDYAATLMTGETVETKWRLTVRTWLQKITGGFDPEANLVNPAIANDIIDLLHGELRGKKAVVWCKFRHEVEYIAARLKKSGVSCVTLMGGTNLRERTQAIKAFNGPAQVLVATELCAQFGSDFSVSDVSIYYSNEWGNQARQQSLKRTVHPHKHVPTLVIDYVTRGTISADVVAAVNDKSIESKLFMAVLENRLLEKLRKVYADSAGLDIPKAKADRGAIQRPDMGRARKLVSPYARNRGSAVAVRVNQEGRAVRLRPREGKRVRLVSSVLR